MGQIPLPAEECHLIRGRGHRRLLFQDRGSLGTGPPMTASWAGLVCAFRFFRGYMTVSAGIDLLQ